MVGRLQRKYICYEALSVSVGLGEAIVVFLEEKRECGKIEVAIKQGRT
jgi:hypothetical protein